MNESTYKKNILIDFNAKFCIKKLNMQRKQFYKQQTIKEFRKGNKKTTSNKHIHNILL